MTYFYTALFIPPLGVLNHLKPYFTKCLNGMSKKTLVVFGHRIDNYPDKMLLFKDENSTIGSIAGDRRIV